MANNVLANSFEAAGAATAWQTGMSPERMRDRAAAYADKERRDQELRTLQSTRPTDKDLKTMAEAQTVELQNALAQQQQMLRDNNKQRTYDAYTRYDADGNVRHINQMLSDLAKSGSKMYGNIARVDKLVEDDRQMLEDMGFPPSLVDAMLSDPELNRSYVRITQKDGTVSFGDLDALKGVTGYNDYADEREIARQKRNRELEMLGIMGYDLDPDGREAFRRTRAELGYDVDPKSAEFQNRYSEVYDELIKNKKRGAGSTAASGVNVYGKPTEREAEAIRRAQLETGMEPTPGDPTWDAAMSKAMSEVNTEFQRPSATRNLEGAESARDALIADGFFETDLNNLTPQQRMKWEPQIRRIEQLSGAELSERDKISLERIQRLTSLGEDASELTDEQTGIIDNVLRTAKAYLFNEVEGVNATAAYSSYRNLVQHALYGAALTPNEQKTFTKAFGSLSQQRGPVLTRLRTTMQELLDTYEAVYRTNDPMVMAYRTGKTGAELMDVMEALDERIQMISKLERDPNAPLTTVNPPPDKVQGVEISPESRAVMDRLSGKNQ